MKKLFIAFLAMVSAVGNVFSQSMTISGGNDHGIVICAQGYLYAWGTNQSNIGSGLLGLDPNDPDYPGDQKFYTSPQRVKMDNGLTFSQVTAGSGAFNLALSCKGIVYAWGENTQNQCGQGSGAATVITEPKPVLCGNDVPGYNLDGSPGGPYLGNVKFVAASTSAGFAILNDGRVVGWGGKNAASWCSEGQVDVPILIKFKDGSDVTNAIHIGAGDDNLLITVDPDGDGMGDLYSIGNWNGRGAVASSNANCYTAQPVMIGSDDDKTALTPLTNVRMAAAADVAGFAVTGDGLVYGWGNTWGGVNGFSKPGTTTQYAHQVVSGAYQDISGEQFLTDVKEVAGGQGYAMAVTKEGYLVYWGNSGGPGGVMPNPNYKGTDTNKEGPQFTYYSSGKIVNDAVKIARGDLFGFMVNDKDEYFAFGSNENGECGLGSTKKIINEVTPMKIPCTTQDACPEGFMVDTIWKCPGTKATLFSGFTTPKSKELSYHFTWSFNGKVLNSSTPMSSTQEMAADEFNQTEISVQDTGRYEVTIEYIGTNVPCNTCVPVTVNTYLGDKSMTIDTLITTSCLKGENVENPKATDEICFKFISKYPISSEFAVYSKSTGGVALDTISLTKASPIGEFCVTGDKVTFNDNAPIDTTYSIWLEDITKEKGSMLESAKPGTETYYQDYYLHLAAYEDVLLESLEMSFSSYGSVSATATPIIYGSAISESNGTLIPDLNKVIKKGKTQDLKLPADGGTATVNIDIELPGSTRGTNYFLFIQTTVTGGAPYVYDWGGGYPYKDNISGNVLVSSLGTEGINDASDKFGPYGNIIFSKLSSYDCGRMEIMSKLYCPPCDDPKKLEIIASETIKDDVDAKYKKVVELCKESDDLVLNIEPLEGKNDPTAKFDIFWFDKFKADEADALIKDITGSATTLETKTNWATVAGATDITKDAEKVYYVMVYDHKNPESCEHYDSIKVIAHPAPIDTLDWIEFCEGELTAEPTFEISGKTINWIDEPKDVTTLTGPTDTGTKEYTYKYTVTDDETGCEGEEHTLTISVNKTGEPKVISPYTLLKDPSVKFQLSVAAPNVDPDCEIRWYESETATSEMTNTSITLDEAKTIEVWAEQYNKETGCTSVRVKVEIVINDAPVPEVTNESLCIDDEIPNLSEYVKVKDTKHTLNWYDDPSAAKGTGSEQAPSFKATAAGTYKFYVSQTNTDTQAESEKATLTITVHEVATLDLAKNKLKYCINESAEELTFSANNDGDFTTATWSKKSDMSDAVATLSPATDEKGEVTYYVQAEYTNTDAQKHYAKAVCPGKIQEITITTNKTDIPDSETNYTVQYLKAEGEKNKSYKSLLDQDGTAVKVEAGHSLKWYDENKNPLSSEPKPEYIENETEGERRVKYFVSQVNQTTGCESELHEVTAIISSFPAPEVKAITLCEGSEKLKSSFPLTAQKSTKGGFAESDYELIWYKKDPKTNPSAEEFKTIDLNLEDLSYDATTETEKDFKYWVVQRYIGPGGGQSPAAELLVSIYSKPILLSHDPDPICLGGEVDLKDLYQISNKIQNQEYELEYFGTTGDIVKTSKATEHGKYQSRAWFTLSSGEVCASTFETVNVTVQELEVAITGDNTTCPGIGVELTAALNPVHMGANDVPSYSWNVSPTGVTGQMETLNTSAEGLSKKGDKLTVNLEVSMGACKGKKPSNAYIVTVDDPGVDGTIKFDEQYNANSGQGTYTLSKDGIIEFDGCNSKVDVLFNVKQTEDEFTYENLETGVVKKDTFSNGEGNFDIKAGLYEVSYINTCKTSFKFKVNDRSLDISGKSSSWSVCEGTPLTIKIVSNDNTPFEYDSRKYKIEWQKDGNTLPGYDTDVLYIPSTTPDDNGAYSYTVTSSGCVYHDKIAMGGSFNSKPKVKINESLLAKDGIYEAIRGTEKEITIPIIRSTGIDMSKLNDKIVWYEDEIKDENIVNKGETLSIQSVESDHEYQIVIANGENGYNTEFCGTSAEITLKVDALLTIDVTLVDGEGKQTKDMCLNEEGVGFLIDTTGTGTVLHPDSLEFKVVETIDGVKKDINWVKKDNYLFAEISPNKSAKYDIVYKYSIGKQDKSVASEITVHPAYEVDWDRDVRICEGGTGFIQITKAEPASEIVLSWESDECLINGSKNGANVEAVYTGSDLIAKKALTLVASNGGICADKKYYPEFTIDKAITGNIVAPEFVCEGHTATLDASSFKATEYVWTSLDQLGEGVTMTGASINVVSKAGYASYTVEMKRGACTETSDATIEVRYAPKFDRIDSLSFRSIEIILQSNTGTAPFQYIVDDKYDENVNEPIKDNLDYGNHSIKIIDAAGCQIDSSFVTNAPGLDFPNHISPNGDGNNDAFSIPVLRDAYPDANIRIYDRWGKKLAEYKAGNAEMDWDGTYNGVQMPSTDYWYEIEIKEIKKTYTGHFTLIRQ